jgi:non-heme Fe2+,alpha-ketoglutarate-dependent halogenase
VIPARWKTDGVLFPIRVLEAEEAASFRSLLEETQRRAGPRRRYDACHLYLRWAWDLAIHPRVVDSVASILGPDLIIHSSRVMVKFAHDPGYVSWHQDGTYTGLNSSPTLTAWIALTDSAPENGCVRVVAGSHHKPPLEHVRTEGRPDAMNRGEIERVDFDRERIVDVILREGEMSMHDSNIIHGSEPNRSARPRIGFNISYATPAVERAHTPVVIARGRDAYPRFDVMRTPPTHDLDVSIAAMLRDGVL